MYSVNLCCDYEMKTYLCTVSYTELMCLHIRNTEFLVLIGSWILFVWARYATFDCQVKATICVSQNIFYRPDLEFGFNWQPYIIDTSWSQIAIIIVSVMYMEMALLHTKKNCCQHNTCDVVSQLAIVFPRTCSWKLSLRMKVIWY